MKKRFCFLVSLLLIAITISVSEVHASDPTIYKLNEGSTYQTGCFPPCLCPITVKQPVTGTFKLTLTSSDGLFDFYNVTDASWVTSVGGSDLRITGSGTYQVGGEFALQQRLTWDRSSNGGAPIHFDSGLVAGGGEFPNINITISINGIHCYDTVIVINASPAQVTPYGLVGGSTYQQGCFPPCLCPISPELSVIGTFGLVKLREGPLFTEYAAVNIVWTVVSADGSVDGSVEGLPIVGTGIFRIGGEFASQQQLSLDLSVNGGPLTHFDSGLVIGGGEFPLIDIELSVNGFYCFDQVIHLMTEPD
jgi:hypothetical protein